MDQIPLPETDEELLAECDVETFRSGGKGGQNVNKVETAVRLRHRPSGLIVACQKERSQHRNKMEALRILRAKITKLNYRAPRRIATKMSYAKKQKITDNKVKLGVKKKLRTKPRATDE